jgi:bifunctional non-homologous end joining protein LigD
VASRRSGPATRAKPADDRLAAYRVKRDFTRTPEPSGAPDALPEGRRFVVQRHQASRLHYDFRLELDGALVSWAVPKGPTLDPDVRRLAMRVEDHPVEYLHFEGVIPSGEYGGGDVIVWDTGTWEPAKGEDANAALEAGDLHIDLHGTRLRGRFVLVRRDDGSEEGRESWMLLHKRDEHAQRGWDPEDHPTSVLSGRTNEEVRRDPDAMWRSDAPAATAAVALRPPPLPDEALDALTGLGNDGTWTVHGRDVRVTKLDKVLFPGDPPVTPPVTKRELLAYAASIAPTLVPYLAGRALNLHRYPDGADRPGFWHKQRPGRAPGWVSCWENPDADEGETTAYVVVDEPATLVWVANFGALEWHPWTSRTEAHDRPTYALFDIDPGERTAWEDVLVLARLHRTALEHLGVTARAKVTGRRGIQIWVPVLPEYTFEQTRQWVELVSRTVGQVVPELVSWEWQVKARKGLARLDYTQNAVNKTLVAPYSPRPAAGAPVSMPIEWDELDDPGLRPDRWTVRTALERLAQRGDPFRAVLTTPQELPPVT